MSRLILVRHGRPQVSEHTAPSTWPLRREAVAAARELAVSIGIASQVRVVASTEVKAIQTAEALNLGPVRPMANFAEVHKPWFKDGSALLEATGRYLAGQDMVGWEPLAEAKERFQRGIEEAVQGRDLVVVTHGTVMTAWLATVAAIAKPAEFWHHLGQPDAWEVDLTKRVVHHWPAPD